MNPPPLLVIAGSARKNSDTESFLLKVLQNYSYQLIDLLDYSLYPYNYDGQYPRDDEFNKITALILQHPHILFATPVYWYSMSGLMKTLFDRFTDLVTIQKDAGRKLKGKWVSLLAVGADEALPQGFTIPFQLTARYLEMEYKGCIYSSTKFPESSKSMKAVINNFRLNSLNIR